MMKGIASMRVTLIMVISIWVSILLLGAVALATHNDPSKPNLMGPTPVGHLKSYQTEFSRPLGSTGVGLAPPTWSGGSSGNICGCGSLCSYRFSFTFHFFFGCEAMLVLGILHGGSSHSPLLRSHLPIPALDGGGRWSCLCMFKVPISVIGLNVVAQLSRGVLLWYNASERRALDNLRAGSQAWRRVQYVVGSYLDLSSRIWS